MGVEAGTTGHLPETAGDGPGICTRQEGGAGSVSIFTSLCQVSKSDLINVGHTY